MSNIDRQFLNKSFISSRKTCSDDYIPWIQRGVAATARYVSVFENFAFSNLHPSSAMSSCEIRYKFSRVLSRMLNVFYVLILEG